MEKKSNKKAIKKLKAENAALKDANIKLNSTVIDLQENNRKMKEQVTDMMELIEQDAAKECGCVTISGDSNYQEFVNILINNGYAVEVERLKKGSILRIAIREGEKLWDWEKE